MGSATFSVRLDPDVKEQMIYLAPPIADHGRRSTCGSQFCVATPTPRSTVSRPRTLLLSACSTRDGAPEQDLVLPAPRLGPVLSRDALGGPVHVPRPGAAAPTQRGYVCDAAAPAGICLCRGTLVGLLMGRRV